MYPRCPVTSTFMPYLPSVRLRYSARPSARLRLRYSARPSARLRLRYSARPSARLRLRYSARPSARLRFSSSYDQFSDVKRLRLAIGGVAFDAAHTHEAVKGLGPKPGAPGLGSKMLEQQLDFALRHRPRQGDEHVR